MLKLPEIPQQSVGEFCSTLDENRQQLSSLKSDGQIENMLLFMQALALEVKSCDFLIQPRDKKPIYLEVISSIIYSYSKLLKSQGSEDHRAFFGLYEELVWLFLQAIERLQGKVSSKHELIKVLTTSFELLNSFPLRPTMKDKYYSLLHHSSLFTALVSKHIGQVYSVDTTDLRLDLIYTAKIFQKASNSDTRMEQPFSAELKNIIVSFSQKILHFTQYGSSTEDKLKLVGLFLIKTLYQKTYRHHTQDCPKFLIPLTELFINDIGIVQQHAELFKTIFYSILAYTNPASPVYQQKSLLSLFSICDDHMIASKKSIITLESTSPLWRVELFKQFQINLLTKEVNRIFDAVFQGYIQLEQTKETHRTERLLNLEMNCRGFVYSFLENLKSFVEAYTTHQSKDQDLQIVVIVVQKAVKIAAHLAMYLLTNAAEKALIIDCMAQMTARSELTAKTINNTLWKALSSTLEEVTQKQKQKQPSILDKRAGGRVLKMSTLQIPDSVEAPLAHIVSIIHSIDQRIEAFQEPRSNTVSVPVEEFCIFMQTYSNLICETLATKKEGEDGLEAGAVLFNTSMHNVCRALYHQIVKLLQDLSDKPRILELFCDFFSAITRKCSENSSQDHLALLELLIEFTADLTGPVKQRVFYLLLCQKEVWTMIIRRLINEADEMKREDEYNRMQQIVRMSNLLKFVEELVSHFKLKSDDDTECIESVLIMFHNKKPLVQHLRSLFMLLSAELKILLSRDLMSLEDLTMDKVISCTLKIYEECYLCLSHNHLDRFEDADGEVYNQFNSLLCHSSLFYSFERCEKYFQSSGKAFSFRARSIDQASHFLTVFCKKLLEQSEQNSKPDNVTLLTENASIPTVTTSSTAQHYFARLQRYVRRFIAFLSDSFSAVSLDRTLIWRIYHTFVAIAQQTTNQPGVINLSQSYSPQMRKLIEDLSLIYQKLLEDQKATNEPESARSTIEAIFNWAKLVCKLERHFSQDANERDEDPDEGRDEKNESSMLSTLFCKLMSFAIDQVLSRPSCDLHFLTDHLQTLFGVYSTGRSNSAYKAVLNSLVVVADTLVKRSFDPIVLDELRLKRLFMQSSDTLHWYKISTVKQVLSVYQREKRSQEELALMLCSKFQVLSQEPESDDEGDHSDPDYVRVSLRIHTHFLLN